MRLIAKLNPVILVAVSGTLLILLLASGAAMVVRRLHPSPLSDEIRKRIRTWWLIASLFLGMLLPGRAVTIGFLAFLSFLALKEYFSLIPVRRVDRRVLFYAYAAILVQYAWVYSNWYGMFAIFIPVYMFLFLTLRMVISGETAGFHTAVGTLHWGLMTAVYSLSHLGALLLLPFRGGSAWVSQPTGGITLLLYLAALTQLNDVWQFLWGKCLGRSKVIPNVSPNKTWAGLIGGICTTTVLSVALAPYLTPLTRMEAVMAGALIGLAGFFGDISVSALKRDLHIKDTGTILPGHGGILDRVDSLTFTAPLFFHLVRYQHF